MATAPQIENWQSMVADCALYRSGKRVRQLTLEEISDVLPRAGDGFVWLGLYEPTEKLLKVVQSEFGLHELAVEDAHAAHQRPKVELYGDSLFVVLRTCEFEKSDLAFGETHIFVGANYLVSVRHGASRSYSAVRARCEATPTQLARGPGYALYAIMDFVVDNYAPSVNSVEGQLDDIDGAILGGDSGTDSLRKIYELKRDLMELRRAVGPLLEVCEQLQNLRTPLIAEEARPYFRDVYDHVKRAFETIETARELLNTALSVNVGLLTMRQNEVVRKLAGWGALLAVPTLIASIYGMNFEHMPELRWSFGYPLALGSIAAICGTLYWRLKRAGWI
jgi:magnesium transporter